MFVSSQCIILQIVHNREVSPEMEEGKMRDDLVQQLIRGSVVLDTMKQEIHTITAMMGGYLDQGELGEITKKDFDDVSLLGLKDGDRTWRNR